MKSKDAVVWVKKVLDAGKPVCRAKQEGTGMGQVGWGDHVGPIQLPGVI